MRDVQGSYVLADYGAAKTDDSIQNRIKIGKIAKDLFFSAAVIKVM